jgi:hypothetical protein
MFRQIMLAAAVVTSTAATAQEAIPFRCPTPGTIMAFSDNTSRTFTRQDGLTCHYRTSDNRDGSFFAGIVAPNHALMARFKGDIEKVWPARVGYKSDFMQLEAWGYQVIVRETTRITVPAGTFDVVPIDLTEEGIRQNMHRSYKRYYYAPSLGYAVKYEPVLERGAWGGSNAPRTIELMRVSGTPAAINVPAPAPGVPAPTPAPATSPGSPSGTAADRLANLKNLFDRKLITPAEYEKKRQEILAGL